MQVPFSGTSHTKKLSVRAHVYPERRSTQEIETAIYAQRKHARVFLQIGSEAHTKLERFAIEKRDGSLDPHVVFTILIICKRTLCLHKPPVPILIHRIRDDACPNDECSQPLGGKVVKIVLDSLKKVCTRVW